MRTVSITYDRHKRRDRISIEIRRTGRKWNSANDRRSTTKNELEQRYLSPIYSVSNRIRRSFSLRWWRPWSCVKVLDHYRRWKSLTFDKATSKVLIFTEWNPSFPSWSYTSSSPRRWYRCLDHPISTLHVRNRVWSSWNLRLAIRFVLVPLSAIVASCPEWIRTRWSSRCASSTLRLLLDSDYRFCQDTFPCRVVDCRTTGRDSMFEIGRQFHRSDPLRRRWAIRDPTEGTRRK